MAEQEIKKQEIVLCHYAVAFIDLLGQQDFLRNFRSIPNSEDPKEIVLAKEQLRNTYGAVTSMRKFFSDSFTAYTKQTIDLSKLTPQQTEEFKTLTNSPIEFQTFSDSIVIFTSLQTDIVKLPVRGIFGILGGAAITSICCLASGHPIRGGIDIGIGMDIAQNDFYGPALSRAYSLESRIANYPRIVVGDELVTYLKMTRDQDPKDIVAIAAKKVAEMCLECISVDDDGHPFVDYLGEYYRKTYGKAVDVSVVQKAYDKVLKYSEKYQKEKNSKLAFRYTLLRNYFEERLPLWEDLFTT